MDAFGLLLWLIALLVAAALVVVDRRRAPGTASRATGLYLAVSWVTFPLAIPIMAMRLSTPPGPSIPPLLTILGLLRAFLGVILASAGLYLTARERSHPRTAAALLMTTLANAAPFLTLALPTRSG